MHKTLILLVFLYTTVTFSQELNCTVNVIAQQTGNDNNVVFKTLEKQLMEYINNTKWAEKTCGLEERNNCSMVINVRAVSYTLLTLPTIYTV